MKKCPHDVSKEYYDSGDSYPICKYCPYVSSGCPFLVRTPSDYLSQLKDAYSGMSEEELLQELKDVERELFM